MSMIIPAVTGIEKHENMKHVSLSQDLLSRLSLASFDLSRCSDDILFVGGGGSTSSEAATSDDVVVLVVISVDGRALGTSTVTATTSELLVTFSESLRMLLPNAARFCSALSFAFFQPAASPEKMLVIATRARKESLARS